MAVKVSIFLCGLVATILAMATKFVHLLWIISADVMYSMMTPQVICVFYLAQWANEYGACFGFVLALLLRGLVGEPIMGLPDVLPLPWDKIQEDGHRHRLFPFRTVIVVISIGAILLVSRFSVWLSEKGLLRKINNAETDANIHYMAPVDSKMVENRQLNEELSHLSSQGVTNDGEIH